MDPYLQNVIVNDKLTIFTFNDGINEMQVRTYFIRNWKTLTLGMDGSTVLFIGGVHGLETGKFGPPEDIQTLKNQVRSIFQELSKRLKNRPLFLV